MKTLFLKSLKFAAGALVLMELFLRIYNPFGLRISGDKIVLFPYKHYVTENTKSSKLERTITRSNNSLGFRGAEPPADFAGSLTIIAVGGSTTESFYLSDGKTWPERLGGQLEKSFGKVWVNNAGMDGHSTFGHAVLLRDYLAGLRPRVLIFMTGLNDMGLAGAGRYDKLLTGEGERTPAARLFLKAAVRSRVAALAQNVFLYSLAKKAGFAHAQLDMKSLVPVEAGPDLLKALRAKHAPFAEAYGGRLKGLIAAARRSGIEPVLATQPLPCGEGTDPETGADLVRLPTGDEYVNCGVKWQILEMYNDAARRAAASEKATLADVARQLPKSSLYFYDIAHFTAQGTEAVAENIYKDICPAMVKLAPAGYKGACPQR